MDNTKVVLRSMWKNNFSTNPSFLLTFFDDSSQACLCVLSSHIYSLPIIYLLFSPFWFLWEYPVFNSHTSLSTVSNGTLAIRSPTTYCAASVWLLGCHAIPLVAKYIPTSFSLGQVKSPVVTSVLRICLCSNN